MYDRNYIIKNDVNLDYNIHHHFSDKVYAKEMSLPKGHVVLSHSHSYSHLSILGKGRCKLYRVLNGEVVETEHSAPECINIPAGIEHQIEALEDITWFCIHATLEKDPKKIDEVAIGATN